MKKFESRPIVEEVIEQEEELLEDAELDPQAREQDIIIFTVSYRIKGHI